MVEEEQAREGFAATTCSAAAIKEIAHELKNKAKCDRELAKAPSWQRSKSTEELKKNADVLDLCADILLKNA